MKKNRVNFLIIISFIFISILSCSLLINSHVLIGADDMQFHLKRIAELSESLAHGKLINYYSFNYFHGSAVMAFYPYFNIIVVGILKLFIGSIFKTIYVYYGVQILVSLLVSYFSYLSYAGNKFKGYIFAVAYSMSPCLFFYQFGNMDLGVVTAYIFLPVVFFGTLKIIYLKRKTSMIVIGLFFIIISHVISIFISLFLILILCLVNLKKIDKKQIINILTDIVISFISTSFVWLYPTYLFLVNHFKIATPGRFALTGQKFSNFFLSIFSNEISPYISIIGIFALFLFVFCYKKITVENKKIFWIAIALILICSNIFPWGITNVSVFKAFQIFQFTWRLYLIPNLLFIYIFSEEITQFSVFNRFKGLITFGIVLLVVLLQFGKQVSLLHTANNRSDFSYSYVNKKMADGYNVHKQKRVFASDNGKSIYKISTDSDYYRLINTYTNTVGPDYYPKQSVAELNSSFDDINNNVVMGSKKGSSVLKRIGYNKFEFFVQRNNKNISLPIVLYKGENLQITLNGKEVSYYNDNGILKLQGSFKGKYIVTINDRISYVFYLFDIISVIIFISYLLSIYMVGRKKKVKLSDN